MRRPKTFIHFNDFLDAHEQESDRGYVLVASAILNTALEYCLRKKTRHPAAIVKRNIDPLFSHNCPLSSFWAKLNFAYAMRLIPEWVFRDLDILRSIRNDLAHTFETFSFTDRNVDHRIRQLRSPYRAADKNDSYVTEARFKTEMNRLSAEEWKHFSESKLRFAMMFHYIHGFLTEGRSYTRRRPTKPSNATSETALGAISGAVQG
jgi:DNA-binding MltR family transcriptional regulator